MHTTYKNFSIHYHDQLELDTLIDEIFKKRTYYVDLDTNTPVIVDAGAHIGLTTLYFHSLYPQARFICIEPNPQNLIYLQKNLEANTITNVTIIPKALIGRTNRNKLYTDFSLTVFSSLRPGGWTGEESKNAVEIETTRLSDVITGKIDILKMDIEGMETEVIEYSQETLRNVGHILLEFHKTKEHSEEKLLRILDNYFNDITVTTDERKERNHNNRLLFIEAIGKNK